MSNLNKITTGTLKKTDTKLEIGLFIYVYKRYTNFSKEIIDTTISNKSFGEKIRVKINNYGDFLGHTTLCVTLPEVHLDISEELRTTSTIDIELEKTMLDDYNNYIRYILIVYRIISKELLLTNITSKKIIDKIQTIFNSENEDFIDYELIKNKVSNEFIIKNTDIKNNLITIYNNNVSNINIDDLSTLRLMKEEINIISANIKLYHKLYYYNQYKLLLDNRDKESINKYNFSWIENVGKFLIKEACFIINNKKIETIYSDWLNIWDELTLTKGQKQGNNVLMGNIKDLTTYNNNKKEEIDIYLN